MAVTAHRNWTYPDEFEDPFYTSFSTMVQSIDDDVYGVMMTATSHYSTYVFVYSSVNQEIAAAPSYTQVVLDKELVDNSSNFASNTYTIPSSGIYVVNGSVQFSSALSGGAYIYKGGVAYNAHVDTLGAANESINVTSILQCTSGTELNLYVYAATTCSVVTNAYKTFMQVIKIS